MIVQFDGKGYLEIWPENYTELYALNAWGDKNNKDKLSDITIFRRLAIPYVKETPIPD